MSDGVGIKMAANPIKGSAAKGCDRDPVISYLPQCNTLSAHRRMSNFRRAVLYSFEEISSFRL
jgi:hypothetical protein